jgi:hypothetical protein
MLRLLALLHGMVAGALDIVEKLDSIRDTGQY